jgi:acyl dehydratase
MTDPDLIYEVDADAVARFARATGETNPIYYTEEAALSAGYPSQVAPFTFPTVIMNYSDRTVRDDPSLDIDWSRVVDGEEAIRYQRPIFVGDRLHAYPRIESVAEKGRLRFLTFRTELRAVDTGELVCAVTATLIERS